MGKSKKKLSSWVGNFLILAGILILLVIYYPFLNIYLNPPKINADIKDGFYLTIPKISAQAPVFTDTDPFNQEEYRKALEKGVAHAKGTKLPGEGGTVFLFAHSSDNPFRLTRYNTIFLRLGELNKGDEIIINKDKKKYIYKVTDKKTVMPWEIKYLKDIKKDQLVLQTCTPIGTAFKRLLVFAQPI